MLPNEQCVILTPCYDKMEYKTQEAISELKRIGYAVWSCCGGSDVARVRSEMASKALNDGFSELFWIDSDITFKTDDVGRLRSHNLPIVAGVYPKRSQSGGISIRPKIDNGDQFAESCEIKFGKNGGLIEVLHTGGAGFLCTRRVVYDDIRSKCGLPDCHGMWNESKVFTPYFLPFLLDVGGSLKVYMGEDHAFSFRCFQSGYKLFVDTTIRLGHVGQYEYQIEDVVGDRPRQESLTMCIKGF